LIIDFRVLMIVCRSNSFTGPMRAKTCRINRINNAMRPVYQEGDMHKALEQIRSETAEMIAA